YLSEFDFRWNHRKVTDGERTVAAIKGIEGKRLRYSDPTKKVHSDEIIPLAKMKDLYLNEKLSLEAIAERLGITKQAVHSRLTTAGVTFRKPGSRPDNVIDKATIIDLYVIKQMPVYHVAKELGIDPRRINAMLELYDIEPRNIWGAVKDFPNLAAL